MVTAGATEPASRKPGGSVAPAQSWMRSRRHGLACAVVRRVYIFLLIGLGVVLFIAISGVLARVFSVDGAERSAITELVQAEAHGDVNGIVERIEGCGDSPVCRARAAEDVAALKHAGSVSILQLNPSAGFSLGSTIGTARVAWNVGSSLPIVQCVRVRRAGDAFTGLRVELLELSPRITTDADCPAHF